MPRRIDKSQDGGSRVNVNVESTGAGFRSSLPSYTALLNTTHRLLAAIQPHLFLDECHDFLGDLRGPLGPTTLASSALLYSQCGPQMGRHGRKDPSVQYLTKDIIHRCP
ncbi:hypothetical protein Bbelb_046390 [Branchiostoma belcheri]|nr:hypothetical protein Bbelb_046390 [Branchiostoma belcheri]